uniref:DUF4794 domain-containing protein n=1 Tax=Anopheles christyi TaxID=43041 RepID=A0A182K1K9_9DIPT
MLFQVLVPCLALLELCAAGYVTVPLHSPAGVTYVNPQQHDGLLAGPVRYTTATQQQAAVLPATLLDARSGAVSVTQAQAPTYYSYNFQPQPVFGKASYTPAVQYHTTYGSPSVRVYEPKSFVYGVQGGASVPATHTIQSVPVSVSTTQYHHTSAPIPVPVTPVPHHHPVAVAVPTPVPVHVPVHVPIPVPVTPTYTKTVTTGPTYIPPQEKHIPVVRSRKFKVRRPAIQNQFYDIEERVIIRPVGSALVELEQPISQTETKTKTTKTTTTTFVEKRPVYSAPAPAPAPAPEVHYSDEGYGTTTTFVEKRPVYSTPAPAPAPAPEVHYSDEGYGTRTTTTFVEKRPVYSTPAAAPAPAPEVHYSDVGYGTRTVARPQVVTQTTTVYTERPPLKGTYDRIEVAAQSKKTAASTSKASDAEYIYTQQANAPSERPFFTQGHAIYHGHQQTAFVNPYATHLAPHPFVYHPANAGHLLHHVAYLNQHSPALLATHPGTAHPATVFHVPSSTPLYPVTPATTGEDCDHHGNAPEYLPPSPQTPPPTTPSHPPVATTTPKPPTSATPGSYPADDTIEDEYDDSIVIDARSGVGTNYSDYSSTDSDYADVTVTAATTIPTTPIVYHHDKYRGSEEQTQTRLGGTSSIEVSYATRTTPASDIVAFDPSTASGGFDFGPSYRGSFPTSTISPSSTNVPSSIVSSSSTSSSSTPQRSVTIISSTTPRTVSARFSETGSSSSEGSSARTEYESDTVTSGISSQSVVVGQGLTQEQIHANQEQFIKLLSERDSIAEVGFGPKGDTSGTLIDAYVRSRVLSATPAPRDAKETSRTVNIRRIVVSRPVETEQEVEVREQGYATTIAPPSYEHKRDVSEVSPTERADRAQQPPVYVNAKPPAFADDRDQ